MKRLEGFCDAVKGSQFMLCHENEKGIYGDTADRCLKIHQTFPQIRAVFDPANFLHSNQDIVEAWKILSPYVEYLHIKDAVEDGTVVPAGQGIGQIPYILEKFQGQVLTVEPHLGHFIGLDKLEAGQKTKLGYAYPSARAAFDAAVNALKEII